jgi:predicted metal-dependent hydrolase
VNAKALDRLAAAAGVRVPLEVRLSPRARRLSLRLSSPGSVRVTVPAGIALAEVEAFLHRHAHWLRERIARMPKPVPFTAGATIPYLGKPHMIAHSPGRGRPVVRSKGIITVTGQREFLGRRLRDWLVAEAGARLGRRAEEAAAHLGRPIRSITLRDPRTRWGSCSGDGRLSFSWRLIMAPRDVLDYVVAHEVAHLAEMNHGPRFWRLVEELAGPSEEQRRWLRAEGARLHLYG